MARRPGLTPGRRRLGRETEGYGQHVLSPVESTPQDTVPPPTPDAPAPEPTRPPAWQRHLAAGGAWVAAQLRRPRTRLAVVGVVLLLLAVLGITGSVWTLPLVIVGAVMVVIAWIGARLDGRFAIEWGATGTQLEFRAQIKAPPVVSRPALAPAAPVSGGPAVRVPTLAQLDDSDVIDGEGHTVEIDVAELKALIATAEARDAGGRVADSSAAGAHRDRPAA